MTEQENSQPLAFTEEIPKGAKQFAEDENTGLPAGFGMPGASDGAPKAPKETFSPGEEAPQDGNSERVEVPQEILAMKRFLPAGLTPETLWDWKQQYGDIYIVDICDVIYVYRALSKPEYKSIMNLEGATREIQEEKIAEKCVLFPTLTIQNLRIGKAGIASTVTEYVMRASGFGAMANPTKI